MDRIGLEPKEKTAMTPEIKAMLITMGIIVAVAVWAFVYMVWPLVTLITSMFVCLWVIVHQAVLYGVRNKEK